MPTASEEIAKVAWPPLSVLKPIEAAPSKKVTVPSGVPDPEAGVTVAVKVTDWPNTDGLTEEDRVVVVETMLEFTVCVRALELCREARRAVQGDRLDIGRAAVHEESHRS